MAAHMNRLLLRSHSHGSLLSKCQPVISHGPTLPVGEQGQQPVRGFPSSKHYLFKWREQRKKKILKVDLPKFIELKKDKEKEPETADEHRLAMKKQGRKLPRTFQELPINISCTRDIIDRYVPPEGDGKHSLLSATGIKDRMTKGTKQIQATRKLKKYEDFDEAEFAGEAQSIVMEAQSLLQDVYKHQDRLHDIVTEKAFPEMVHGLETKTMKWSLVETVEPPKVTQVRVEEVISDKNLFAQVTVRLHTKQILAIYDRFGRLMYGDPSLPKSVVEYVVMEKWISDTYGRWRVHAKIIPDWLPPRGTLLKTYRVPTFEPPPPPNPNEEGGGDDKKKSEGEAESSEQRLGEDGTGKLEDGGGGKPKLALA